MIESAFLMNLLVFASILGLAALGGMFSERSGVINIALEGKMLMAACVTGWIGGTSGSALIGLAAGVCAAIALSLAHYLLTQVYSIEHIVAGMAINVFAYGATNFIALTFIKPGASNHFLPIPVYLGLALLASLVSTFVFARTRAGLRLLAVGESPEKSRVTGLDPLRVRLQALIVTGVLCGLSGALIVTNSGAFSDNMTSGRGFIALAALILGGWRPVPATLACLAFAAFEAGQIQLQGTKLFGYETPAALWNAMPYVITLVALAGFVGRAKAPAGLGKA